MLKHAILFFKDQRHCVCGLCEQKALLPGDTSLSVKSLLTKLDASTASELKLFGIFGIVGACIKDTGKYVMMWILLKEPAGKVSHVPLFLIWRRVGAQIAEKTDRLRRRDDVSDAAAAAAAAGG